MLDGLPGMPMPTLRVEKGGRYIFVPITNIASLRYTEEQAKPATKK